MTGASRILGLIVILFGVWSIRATWLYSIDEQIRSPELRLGYSVLVKAVIWISLAAAYIKLARNVSPWDYLGFAKMPDKRRWLRCIGVMFGFLCGVLLFEAGLGPKRISVDNGERFFSLSAVLVYLVSPFIEEVLFRGLIQRELMRHFSNPTAAISTSVLFVAIHLPYWISTRGFSPPVLVDSLGVFVFSMVSCWIFVIGRSIWPCAAAHSLNNIVSALLSK